MAPTLLLDIDGTLTPPRRDLEPEMAAVLGSLAVPFAVAAGSDLELIEPQFFEPLWRYGFRRDFDAFVSNGGTRCRCHFSRAYEIDVVDRFDFAAHLGSDYAVLLARLEEALADEAFALPPGQKIVGERIIDRGSMLNLAPPGRERGGITAEGREARERFVDFDRREGYRLRLKAFLEETLRPLRERHGLLVMLGGQTSFDLVIEGRDKTRAIHALRGQGVDEIVFVGDALFAGGNDEPVLRFVEAWRGPGACPVEAVCVDGWRDTIETFRRRGWLEGSSRAARRVGS